MKLTTEKLKKLILSEMKSYDVVSETEVDGFSEPEDDEDRLAGRMELDLENGLEDLKKNPEVSNRIDIVQAIDIVIEFLKLLNNEPGM